VGECSQLINNTLHLWNSLPADIQTCPSVTVFNTKLKTLLHREAFNCWF